MRYKHIFWDWNGTLLDDLQVSIDSINKSLSKRQLPLMNRKRYMETFGFPVEDYYKRIGFDLEKESYAVLADEFIDYYNAELNNAALQRYVGEVIARFALSGIKQYILSASERDILEKGLKRFGINTFFTDLIALDDIYAHGKIGVAKDWFAKNDFNEKALMVGDTYHDYEVAAELGLDCILYSGGHTDRSKLYDVGVPVITDYRDLYHYVFEPEELRKLKMTGKTTGDDGFIEQYKAQYDDQKIFHKVYDNKSDW